MGVQIDWLLELDDMLLDEFVPDESLALELLGGVLFDCDWLSWDELDDELLPIELDEPDE